MRHYLTSRMLGAHLLALLSVGAAAGLGLWQYDAWQATRAAEARDLTRSAPVALVDLMGPDDPFPGDRVGQPVTISGTWLPEGTVYVSGREHDGREGYWVVTPVTAGTPEDPALPIVRGWVESPGAAPAAPTGTVDLQGLLQPSEGTGALDTDPLDDVYPQLRIADLVQRIDNDLFSAYAVLTGDGAGSDMSSEALVAADIEQLPDPGQLTGLRNLLYALEWWVFGAFALFIWWRFVRESMEETAPEHPVAFPS